MPDVFTKKKRSAVMSLIRGRGNKTELVMASLLRQSKLSGWRRHHPIAGRPDFVFPKRRVAIFVDGCFWHGCKLHGNLPVNNRPFWREKLNRNRARDRVVGATLRASGWQVVRIWEHEFRNPGRVLRRVTRALSSDPL